MAAAVGTRRSWSDNGIVPRGEMQLFRDLLSTTTTMNRTVLEMAKRYPFLFGVGDVKALKKYVAQMERATQKFTV